MYLIQPFTVVPSLPESLKFLGELACNMWWAWNRDAVDLIRRLDRDLWDRCGHNPVLMLGQLPQTALEQASADEGFLVQMDRIKRQLEDHMTRRSWFDKNFSHLQNVTIAYFSAEFGLNESLPLYSGGLGVLAGDHLKAASDLGLPLVGVGLMYRQGYFRQYLNADGWQQETYPSNDFYTMPARLVTREGGKEPLTIGVEYPGRLVKAQVWRIQVGRIPLFALDCDIEANSPEDRQITAQLYGGDNENRIRQELMLGIGGVRALAALGIEPSVCHMNEGHSAFLAVERARRLQTEHGIDYLSAREATRASQVFTTHTPVPAGIDRFPPAMIEKYLSPYYQQLGIGLDEFLSLGRQNPYDMQETFSMAVLALRTAAAANGVSKLHGKVSRAMWQNVWPAVPEDELPITSITNGIHTRSWISGDMATLLDRYLGTRWARRPEDHTVWQQVDQIPDEELWRTHERRRERLVAVARRRLAQQLIARGAPSHEIATAGECLDAEALTIGFARRFATYKRAALLFEDMDRLKSIISDRDRPVQIIFAGKAHPRDNGGKDLIRKIIHHARDESLRRRIVFLEDYDMNMARYMLQGCDVWLNTPRRPLEASGTSGMKAAANGALNLSILDGWWDEAYTPGLGWAVGRGEQYDDLTYQDKVESAALYDLLEKEIVPLFYERTSDSLPRGWIRSMKQSLGTLGPMFNATRMVMEYTERLYMPSMRRARRLAEEKLARAGSLSRWKQRVRDQWSQVRVGRIEAALNGQLRVGEELAVSAEVALGGLTPEDVSVQLYTGSLDAIGRLSASESIPMKPEGDPQDGRFRFVGQIRCQASGRRGFAIRVLPNHEDLANPLEMGLIRWAE
ncbi:MAG: Glycogen phosphorylase [Phycisphaerae bacterium]|nr:Glycogen phosphorylase [Phycisphaerae bacterium]